ncbi:AbrB/MazE/SpoVT family DNA-binding domain-containing protein [Vulcanisaeta distributa]|uniref:Transcriptional regulator, AbrB family n=1 Tax=Vulcanisaeta distributa (strain DSM 14429 / JCM 11212 / NBRC 100878 / IC-017) TaxID=572478 RepID=E1QQG9_VULDI|nr:AbrB/MazE/SpoVT family DNA-binding domain-containing protein [Vulcanisaeta distributa]ADN50464.1 transcriptional regulator, AbrB family [Vulcanisaeta distributa DSM 14429]
MLEVRVRVSKKNTIYIPKAISEAVGISEGDYVVLRVDGNKIIIERVEDPFEYALKVKKFAEVTFEEFERESEEMQNEYWSEASDTS